MRPSLQLVGLSLSFCIQDVLRGRVAVRDIGRITAGTAARTRREFEGVLRSYGKIYWRYPHGGARRAKCIARRLWAKGLIDQPRLRNEQPVSLVDGHWQRADGSTFFPPWNEP